jgi:hypothetical protein
MQNDCPACFGALAVPCRPSKPTCRENENRRFHSQPQPSGESHIGSDRPLNGSRGRRIAALLSFDPRGPMPCPRKEVLPSQTLLALAHAEIASPQYLGFGNTDLLATRSILYIRL